MKEEEKSGGVGVKVSFSKETKAHCEPDGGF